jgi:hypothetical protein
MKTLFTFISFFVVATVVPFAETIRNPRVPQVYPVQVKRRKK